MARLQVPPLTVPIIASDGSVSQPWMLFFLAIEQVLGGYNTEGAQPASPVLTGLAELNATGGLVAQLDADDFTKRTITGTAGQIAVTNGAGVSGNPTIALAAVAGVSGVHASPTSITVDGFGRITAISP
ncbi:MAG TPA: hypothetical protein VIO94_15970 [Phenylobacterium sp.]